MTLVEWTQDAAAGRHEQKLIHLPRIGWSRNEPYCRNDTICIGATMGFPFPTILLCSTDSKATSELLPVCGCGSAW